MNKSEILGSRSTQSSIEEAYKLKECLDYIECGSFQKDLYRVRKTISTSKRKTFTSNKKDNPKIGTLIGKSLFFSVLTNDSVIKNVQELKDIFVEKEIGDQITTYFFDNFSCIVRGEEVIFCEVS